MADMQWPYDTLDAREGRVFGSAPLPEVLVEWLDGMQGDLEQGQPGGFGDLLPRDAEPLERVASTLVVLRPEIGMAGFYACLTHVLPAARDIDVIPKQLPALEQVASLSCRCWFTFMTWSLQRLSLALFQSQAEFQAARQRELIGNLIWLASGAAITFSRIATSHGMTAAVRDLAALDQPMIQ